MGGASASDGGIDRQVPRAPAKLPVALEYGLPSKLGCNGPSLISIRIPLALAASRSPMAGAAAIGPCGTGGHGSRPSPTARAAAGPDSACGRGGVPDSTGKCRAFTLRLCWF